MSNLNNDSTEIHELIRLTWEVVKSPKDDDKFENWKAIVRNASTFKLIEVTARLSSIPGKDSRELKALREAIISEIERKNSQDVIRTMEKLDDSASKLTKVSLFVAIVGVIIAIVGVVLTVVQVVNSW